MDLLAPHAAGQDADFIRSKEKLFLMQREEEAAGVYNEQIKIITYDNGPQASDVKSLLNDMRDMNVSRCRRRCLLARPPVCIAVRSPAHHSRAPRFFTFCKTRLL
jgi:hypothetical protein